MNTQRMSIGIAVGVILIGVATMIVPRWVSATPNIPSGSDDRSIIVKIPTLRNRSIAKVSSEFQEIGLQSAAKKTGAVRLRRLATNKNRQLSEYAVVEFDHAVDLPQVLRAFQREREVEVAGPNIRFHAHFVPNDPDYASSQWNFEKVGAESAWDYDTITPARGGDPSIIVAVIDTGVAYEDFGEFSQASDLSDTNFVAGTDLVSDDTHANDDNGHGTHVTGTIAENTNNDELVAGLAFNTSIMPIKVLDELGEGTLDDVAAGIVFATDNGAHVINMSLGSRDDDLTGALEAAISDAVAAGIILVASSGNDGADSVSIPANYDGVIAVGATGEDDEIASYSNTGSDLDIVAPGGSAASSSYIFQQTFSNLNAEGFPQDHSTFDIVGYRGTSMAAPHVSASVALLLAYGVDSGDVESILTETAVDLESSGRDNTSGYGRLDLDGAFALAAGDTEDPSNPTSIKAYTNSDRSKQITEDARTRDRDPYFRWTGATDTESSVAGYYVYFGTSRTANPYASGSFQTENTLQIASLSSTTNDKDYYLRIRTRDDAGNISDTTTTFHLEIDRKASRPTNVSASNVEDGIRLRWNEADPNAETYRIYRSKDSDGPFNYVDRTTATSWIDEHVADNKTYYYKIKTVDDLDNMSSYTTKLRKTYHQP
ncbi:MAG: S8 family serine peptidase [Candidatus Kerfeldbacteria bacterium]|nr:S8 family serine peptidase [Candidatus Kerfeldbacteria bacterium]